MVEEMNMHNAVNYVHSILSAYVGEGDVAIDATVGNGWDTALLSERVGANGVVYGFDIQPLALEITRKRTEAHLADIRLFLEGHERLDAFIDAGHKGAVKAVTFNLGYLPGGDKDITTGSDTTEQGLIKAKSVLSSDGVITVVCYRHAEGERELNVVRTLLSSWPQDKYTVIESTFINQRGAPPVVFVVSHV